MLIPSKGKMWARASLGGRGMFSASSCEKAHSCSRYEDSWRMGPSLRERAVVRATIQTSGSMHRGLLTLTFLEAVLDHPLPPTPVVPCLQDRAVLGPLPLMRYAHICFLSWLMWLFLYDHPSGQGLGNSTALSGLEGRASENLRQPCPLFSLGDNSAYLLPCL